MSSKTPLGLSLIKDPHLLPPHLKITVISKASFISPLQLVFQDLLAKSKNKIPPSLLCCRNFLWTILRNSIFTYPPARNPELNFSKKDQDDSIFRNQDEVLPGH
ncbi:hypothetical protein TNCV_2964471 [Trichonephila clavipes]|nr:hypothetical protein TNCV_2964471 [Trichonephila clavipes]